MRLSLSVLALASALAAPATAQEVFPAKLAGHAYLPALSLVEPPADRLPVEGLQVARNVEDDTLALADDFRPCDDARHGGRDAVGEAHGGT